MSYVAVLLSSLAFRSGALQNLAARKSIVLGAAVFAIGFAVFTAVRNAVYASLRTFEGAVPVGLISSIFDSGLPQALLFVLAVYIPVVVGLGNAISGDGLGFTVSREEYRRHAAALLPLWGAIFLLSAPVQIVLPQFLTPLPGFLTISIGRAFLTVALAAYTVWAVRELSFLPLAAAGGVFVLSWLTIPLFLIMTAFLLSLPFFLMFPLLYLAWQRLRGLGLSRRREQELRQHLHSLTLNPQDSDAHHQLGLICLGSGRLDEAERHFREAIRIDPNDPEYRYYLGRAFEKRGDWPAALEQYEETYRANPQQGLGDIIREVGKGYLHTGHAEKAREFLQFFLDSRGSDPEGRYWLAVAGERLGRPEEARAQLNTILEQARSNPRFFRKEHREWIYRSRQMLRRMRRL